MSSVCRVFFKWGIMIGSDLSYIVYIYSLISLPLLKLPLWGIGSVGEEFELLVEW